MSKTYVGFTPRFLADGRPIVFGDVLEDADLPLADEGTKLYLEPPLDPAETAASTAPSPKQSPAPQSEAPAKTDNPEPEAK